MNDRTRALVNRLLTCFEQGEVVRFTGDSITLQLDGEPYVIEVYHDHTAHAPQIDFGGATVHGPISIANVAAGDIITIR